MSDSYVTVLASVLGAVAAVFAKQLIDLLRTAWTLRNQKSISGEWHSWSWDLDSSKDGVYDRVSIKQALWGLQVTNLDHPLHKYKCTGKVHDGRHFVGHWKSVRSASRNSGPFVFTIGVEGDYLIGVYGDFNDKTGHAYCAWCLTRDKNKMEETKELLRKNMKLPSRNSSIENADNYR